MPWRRDHLFGVETYDELVARHREQEDPYPGASGFDDLHEACAGPCHVPVPDAPVGNGRFSSLTPGGHPTPARQRGNT